MTREDFLLALGFCANVSNGDLIRWAREAEDNAVLSYEHSRTMTAERERARSVALRFAAAWPDDERAITVGSDVIGKTAGGQVVMGVRRKGGGSGE